jgi:hypothetical protein
MVTHLPARFYRLVPCFSSDKPTSRWNDLAGRSADPFLPAGRSVLSRAMSEERDIFWLRPRSLNRYQTSHQFRLSSRKYRRFETRVRQAVKSECSKNPLEGIDNAIEGIPSLGALRLLPAKKTYRTICSSVRPFSRLAFAVQTLRGRDRPLAQLLLRLNINQPHDLQSSSPSFG